MRAGLIDSHAGQKTKGRAQLCSPATVDGRSEANGNVTSRLKMWEIDREVGGYEGWCKRKPRWTRKEHELTH